jgi:hypothetical protein
MAYIPFPIVTGQTSGGGGLGAPDLSNAIS